MYCTCWGGHVEEWPHYQNLFQTAGGGHELKSCLILAVSGGEEMHNQPFKQRRYERTDMDSDINSISGIIIIILIPFLKLMFMHFINNLFKRLSDE